MVTKAADLLVESVGRFQDVFGGNLEVPAVSRNTMRVVELCTDPSVTIDEAVEVIAMDPVLSAAALRVANSAMYSGQMQVSLVRGAVMRLGLRWVGNLAISLGAVKSVRCARSMFFDPDAHWENSLYRAVCAEQAVSALPLRGRAPVFAASLLQDIALPLLANEYCMIYGPVLDASEGKHRLLVRAEHDLLKWSHADAGAWVASQWALPDDMAIGITCHHLTQEELIALDADRSPLAAVAFSGIIPDCCSATIEDVVNFAAEAESRFKLSDSTLRQILSRSEATLSDLLAIFGLTSQRKSLVGLLDGDPQESE